MKNTIIMLVALIGLSISASAQIYQTASGKISFFSKTPVEDIDAKSNTTVVLLNTNNNEVVFKVQNTAFKFPNKLMEEHFNEKYMESEKYPNSIFSGKINETIDFTKDGSYDVTVTGKLNIHGVEQLRTFNGKVVVQAQSIQLVSDFKVKVADHKIDIPKLVVAKIAEVIDVHVDTTLIPRK
jgi:polyisoprenoid-binding protein YceI